MPSPNLRARRRTSAVAAAVLIMLVASCTDGGTDPTVLGPASGTPGSPVSESGGAEISPDASGQSSDTAPSGSAAMGSPGGAGSGSGTADDSADVTEHPGGNASAGSTQETPGGGTTGSGADPAPPSTGPASTRPSATPTSTTPVAGATTHPTISLPPQPTITLASSLVVTVQVPQTVDVTGIDVAGAKRAYRNLITVTDSAVAQPNQDWSNAVRKYATDPAASAILSEIASLATNGIRIIGHSSYVATITDASEKQVKLRICTDNSGQDIVDESGHSVKSGLGGTHPQWATLTRSDSGVWRVSRLSGDAHKTC